MRDKKSRIYFIVQDTKEMQKRQYVTFTKWPCTLKIMDLMP